MSSPETGGPTPDEIALIETRLHEATSDVPLPPADVDGHLARGRRRVRRQRVAVAGAAVVTAAVLATGATVLMGTTGDDSRSALTSRPDRATDPRDPGEPATPTREPTTRAAEPTPTPDDRSDRELLLAYRDVIAEYVDPRDEHLQRVPDNQQSGGGLGTKLGWSEAGQDGLGLIEVFVSDSWADQWYMWCDATQDCRDLVVGRIDARVLRENGTTWVGVQRSDGSVAVVSASALFGNNSVVPVSGMDVSEADLARAAADPRLTLPAQGRAR